MAILQHYGSMVMPDNCTKDVLSYGTPELQLHLCFQIIYPLTLLVLSIDLIQSIHHVFSQSLAAVDHNWVLNKVATPLGTFHIIILSREKIVMAFFPLFEFGKIRSDSVWAPKNQFYTLGELYFMCTLYPYFPVERCITGQQSQFNCTAGLLESVTTPKQVIDESCFLATNYRKCRSEYGTVLRNQFLLRLRGPL